MELLCAEKINQDNCCAMKDLNIMNDERVLEHLLKVEPLYVPRSGYFNQQTGMESSTRKIVTKWMLEVCDALNCEAQVFPLAVNLYDRFLSNCNTPKRFLQLLAADCILVASKIRQAVTISIEVLCKYTNDSVTRTQMKQYELLLVGKLDWDLLAVTGYDFIDHILQRVNCGRHEMVRRHSIILVHLCYTELDFMRFKPSTIATACVVSAMKGVKLKIDLDTVRYLCSLTNSSMEDVLYAVDSLDCIVSEASEDARRDRYEKNVARHNSSSMTSVTTDEEKPVTPTDVQDVEF